MRFWPVLVLIIGIIASGAGAAYYFVPVAASVQPMRAQKPSAAPSIAAVCASLAQDGEHSGLCP